HQSALLPAHDQEHDLDEGHAGVAAADQRDPIEVQERSPAATAGDHGALPGQQGEPARRLPADGRPDPDLLRALCRALGLGGASESALHLLWPSLRHGAVDLRPGGARPHLRAAALDGRVDVRPAEDDAGDGGSAPGQDDALHAGPVHVHVPQPAIRARPLLDALQRASDRSTEVHGAPRQDGEGAGPRAEEGVTTDPARADTIVAIATPPGSGAIGVVRLSGSRAVSLSSPMLRMSPPKSLETVAERVVHRATVVDPMISAELDVVLALKMLAPRSATGEDVVEISAHGNPVLLAKIVELLVDRGARLADPGEFSRRAYLNGRMDLIQVEAVAELIAARTDRAVRMAARQLRGALSSELAAVRERLLDLVA